MTKPWIITNLKNYLKHNSSVKNNNFNFYVEDKKNLYQSKEGIIIHFEGYVIPRLDISKEYQMLCGFELIYGLYRNYSYDFIKKVKGNFIITIIENENFHIFSDRFGIKKFFYWISGQEFIISNDLKSITTNIQAKPSAENMAIYALVYHFVGGKTIFENINYNKPAEVVSFENGVLSFSKYWNVGELLTLEREEVSIEEISEALTQSVEQSLVNVDGDSISLSLTGGADTRNLLSVFLKLGIKPHLYTYGNPKSDDCVKASAISNGLNIKHTIHDIIMTPELFDIYSKFVVRNGQSLASIHRAHRILSVQREGEFADKMFLGTLGGEFIKGVSEDDYIVPSVVYENWYKESLSDVIIGKKMDEKSLLKEEINLTKVTNFLNSELYLQGDYTSRKFHSLSHITASLHDAQDINLYETIMKNVYTPFLDIDYLEILFTSQFTFNNKELIKNKYLRRIENPIYGSKFIKATFPPLLDYEYSGNHNPKEVLFNKYYAAFAKAIRKKMRPKYPSNFPLDKWMYDFVVKELSICNDYDNIKKIFNLNELESVIYQRNYIPKESFWLRFTNPIMMRYILDEFKN